MSVASQPTEKAKDEEKPKVGASTEHEHKQPEVLEDTPAAVQKRREKEQADAAAKAK